MAIEEVVTLTKELAPPFEAVTLPAPPIIPETSPFCILELDKIGSSTKENFYKKIFLRSLKAKD